jgi:Ca2+-binding RTX toxin-like protein
MTRRNQHRRVRARRMAIVLSATAALSVAAIGPGRTFGATCDGMLAAPGDDASYQPGPSGVTIDRSTAVADVVIIGSEGNDTLKGGAGNDHICGRGGNDTIEGNAGDDTIFGNSGSDYINGGVGLDNLHAGWGVFDEIDATDGAVDPVLDCGFGLFKYCHGDGGDVFPGSITLFTGGPQVGLNPFPLPPP